MKGILEVLIEHIDHSVAEAPEEEECADKRESNGVVLSVDAEHIEEWFHVILSVCISTWTRGKSTGRGNSLFQEDVAIFAHLSRHKHGINFPGPVIECKAIYPFRSGGMGSMAVGGLEIIDLHLRIERIACDDL